MRKKYSLAAPLLGFTLTLASPFAVAAPPVAQVSVGFETSKFVDGLDLTGDSPLVSLSADLSFENGTFAGLDCYKSENLFFSDGIDAGCNYYLGYFNTLGNGQALSATLSRSEYAPTPDLQWDYTTATLSWHTNRSTILTLSATDDWFGRGFSSVGLAAAYQRPLSERWSANVEVGRIGFEGTSPVSSIDYARLGLRFEQGRWTSELNIDLGDSELEWLTPLEVDTANVSLRFIYRLY